ncbi:AraC family transcriptional regulator [Halobacillus sp. BAB-2008]|uniref:helix-turn-helix transcriptional regulator n=1 Tax=Halobacillus sp. BAB-2008 TaxID=1246484 RepID=UPI0002A4FFA2|nr:AraC family transcriptional regulator [Halobacillus sp. BAB-2008]
MPEPSIIQKSIAFMEERLKEGVSMEEVAAYAGYSPYHFHRKFLKEVGVSISEYMRKRRLTEASRCLLHTNAPIIDIAFSCHFESQEAFTRAFKQLYGLPPGRFRKLFATYFEQKGEDAVEMISPINGWFLSGGQPANYEVGRDDKEIHEGNRSAYLTSISGTSYPSEGDFATLMQQFKAVNYLDKRVRLSGFIKTEHVESYAGMWMRVDNAQGEVLQFDNMSDRKITGTQNWNHYSIVLDVPNTASVISIGTILSGVGKVWMDAFQFDIVDEHVPTTNMNLHIEMQEEPMNLSFDE